MSGPRRDEGSGGPSGGRKARVAVVFGGRSAEHEVSVVSARSVLEALDPERYEILTIGIDKQGRWHQLRALPARRPGERALPSVAGGRQSRVDLSRDPSRPAVVAADGTVREIDVVFPVLHGPFGEDGTLQGLLELAGIPYVGSGVLASAVGMDKAIQKALFTACGLPVAPHLVVNERDWESDRDGVSVRAAALGLPLFVKPATLGSSVGISKVRALEELAPAVEEALSHGRKALIERSAEGYREIECSVLGNDEPVASVPGEVIPAGEFYDYAAKYLDEGAQLVVPARLPRAVGERVRRMAIQAFQAIDGAGMARVDFFYREPEELLVNEINTIPGFTEISMYPKLWEASGIPYRELLDRLIELALERHAKDRKRGRALGDP